MSLWPSLVGCMVPCGLCTVRGALGRTAMPAVLEPTGGLRVHVCRFLSIVRIVVLPEILSQNTGVSVFCLRCVSKSKTSLINVWYHSQYNPSSQVPTIAMARRRINAHPPMDQNDRTRNLQDLPGIFVGPDNAKGSNGVPLPEVQRGCIGCPHIFPPNILSGGFTCTNITDWTDMMKFFPVFFALLTVWNRTNFLQT